MKIVDWTPRVQLRDGRVGTYEGRCPFNGRHRVRTAAANPDFAAVWTLDDYGRCRGDLAESPCDYASAA